MEKEYTLHFDAGRDDQGRSYPIFELSGLTRRQVETIMNPHPNGTEGVGPNEADLICDEDGRWRFSKPQVVKAGSAPIDIPIEVDGKVYRTAGHGILVSPEGATYKILSRRA